MKRRIFLLSWALILLSFTGCFKLSTKTYQYVPFPSAENPEMARIYVLRPQLFGGLVAIEISDNNKPIGTTIKHGYLCWERQPGHLTITSMVANNSRLELDVEKGKNYYVHEKILFSDAIGRPRDELILLDEEKGKALLNQCEPASVVQ